MESSQEILDWKWSSARQFLPFDLDGLATDCGALERRRGVKGGEALVRALLLVGLPHASLERASVMARESGIATLNTTAMFKRLCKSESLLQTLYEHTLRHAVDVGERSGKFRLLAVDATALCGPGAKMTDQRLHTVYDLGKGQALSVDLTGPEGGEALWRHHSFGFGDLVLGDCGYGYNRSFHWALRSGARILIRFRFEGVTLYDEHGERIWADAANSRVPESGTVELRVEMANWPSPLRAVGSRNPKGEPVWLLTDLSHDELPTLQVRELYRKRWQVELYFKRLKSLLDLGELPTRDGPTARPWIWAKLILASLAVLLAHERFSPWGYACAEPEPLESLRLRCLGTYAGSALAMPAQKTRTSQRQAKTTRSDTQATLSLEA
jgi:hypothetical protein